MIPFPAPMIRQPLSPPNRSRSLLCEARPGANVGAGTAVRCGRSLTEPPGRPKVSKIGGDLRSAVSARSETLAEHGRLFPASCLSSSANDAGERGQKAINAQQK